MAKARLWLPGHETGRALLPDFRRARRLGKNDGLFEWTKVYQQSEILSADEWVRLPAQITVPLLRFTATIRGFRSRRVTLVTTILDAFSFTDHDHLHEFHFRDHYGKGRV